MFQVRRNQGPRGSWVGGGDRGGGRGGCRGGVGGGDRDGGRGGCRGGGECRVGVEVKPEPHPRTRLTVGVFKLTCCKQQLGHISVGKR